MTTPEMTRALMSGGYLSANVRRAIAARLGVQRSVLWQLGVDLDVARRAGRNQQPTKRNNAGRPACC